RAWGCRPRWTGSSRTRASSGGRRARTSATPGTPANGSSLPAKSPLPPTGSRGRAGWNRRHREHSVMHARKKTTLIPLALQDAPALIETVFPAQKVSFEAQKERKANLGQTLTGLEIGRASCRERV